MLDAVVRVATRRGLQRVSNRTVAQEAGLSHGLVSHHFGSRDEMLHEAVANAAQESIDVSAMVPPSGRLEDFSAGLADLVAKDPDMQAFQFEVVLESRRMPTLADEARALYDTYLAAMNDALVTLGISPTPALARAVFAALDGLVMQQLIYDDPDETRAAVEELCELLALKRDAPT
jgi:AcrR family transcriptional regulator